jgi:hypothetical protein
MILLDAAFSQLKGSTQAYVAASYPITQAGYAFLYVSNEQPTLTDVYFDDVKMTHTSKIIPYNEYYPFGMQSSESYTKANSTNNFLYDQGGELNAIDKLSIGYFGVGFTIQGANGGLDSISFGVDSGVGLGVLFSGSLSFNSEVSYVFK